MGSRPPCGSDDDDRGRDHAGDPIPPEDLERRNTRRAYDIKVQIEGELEELEITISDGGVEVSEVLGEYSSELDSVLTKLVILALLILLSILLWRLGAVVQLAEIVASWAVEGTTLPFAPS